MGTLAALKTRIATDLARPDLTSDIANAIADAIDEYSDTPFYFLMEESTRSTVAGTPTVALPDNFRRLQMLTVTAGSQRKDLPPERHLISYDEYRERIWDTSSRGEPCDYAIWNELVHFDPVPDAVYVMTFSFFGPVVGVPATDDASNAWTTEAEQLIRAHAKMLLYRDRIRNLEQAQVQERAALRHKARLLGRTAAQSCTYRARPRYF
jgi:hypothetical protein